MDVAPWCFKWTGWDGWDGNLWVVLGIEHLKIYLGWKDFLTYTYEQNIGTDTHSKKQNPNEKSHIEGKTLWQQSLVKGEEKS